MPNAGCQFVCPFDLASHRGGLPKKQSLYEMAPVAQLVLGLLSPLTSTIPYTDSLVAPVPASHYVRYVTFLATGTRTFTCDPSNATSKYTLASFDYDLYDAEADPSTRKLSLGKHVLMTNRNPDGGNSVFYTANDTFTYWLVHFTSQPKSLSQCRRDADSIEGLAKPQ
ncbi:hypothetical protein SLS62_000608 [Diatrype stigma]|uniref:Uncharacterized protein n=1 Tax=Diatrype stigma TaxID=117547 RepID=A0AAN9YSP0_9PEZI